MSATDGPDTAAVLPNLVLKATAEDLYEAGDVLAVIVERLWGQAGCVMAEDVAEALKYWRSVTGKGAEA